MPSGPVHVGPEFAAGSCGKCSLHHSQGPLPAAPCVEIAGDDGRTSILGRRSRGAPQSTRRPAAYAPRTDRHAAARSPCRGVRRPAAAATRFPSRLSRQSLRQAPHAADARAAARSAARSSGRVDTIALPRSSRSRRQSRSASTARTRRRADRFARNDRPPVRDAVMPQSDLAPADRGRGAPEWRRRGDKLPVREGRSRRLAFRP